MEAAFGPYRVLRRLGSGGMGVVYEGIDAQGSHVAIKVVRMPEARLLHGLRREVRALSRLRHPGIVPIVYDGTSDPHPWYAMALLEGRTLRDVIAGPEASTPDGGPTRTVVPRRPASEAATDPIERPGRDSASRTLTTPAPIPIQDALTITRNLCDPVAFLHGEGLVHRDLKPENVLLRPDGTPVLIDFGLARRLNVDLGRDRLDVAEDVEGTLAYMSPEQARGGYVDARADLYALGCILYELLTGRPPFVASSAAQMIWLHARQAPVPPRELVSAVPPEVDEIVRSLLEKEPQDRLPYADTLAKRLEHLGARPGPRGPAPRPYVYRARMLGRERELARAASAVERLAQGKGARLLVRGVSGIGKTRLLAELGARAASSRIMVLTGECTRERIQLEPFREPLARLADRCVAGELPATAEEMRARAAVLAPYVPGIARLARAEIARSPGELSPDLERERLVGDVVATFVAASRDLPILLLLDDLGWADELTSLVLERLIHVDEGARISVVGAYRAEDETEGLARLARAAAVGTLELGELGDDDVGSMAGEMLGLRIGVGLVPALVAGAEGNPLFLGEHVRAAVESALLVRDRDGRWAFAPERSQPETLPLPSTLRELLASRLARLSEGARRLAELAALLGREGEVQVLASAHGAPDGAFLDALQELLRAHVLEEEELRVRFRHDKLREIAEPQRGAARVDAARRLALAIDALPGERTPEELAMLGRLWSDAGAVPRARTCLLAAGRAAVSRHGLEQAEASYVAYLELAGAPSVDDALALDELGLHVHQRRGRMALAEEAHRKALAIATQAGDADRVRAARLHLAAVLVQRSQTVEAGAILDDELASARSRADAATEAKVLANQGTLLFHQGRLEEAAAHYDAELRLARRNDDRRTEAAALGHIGGVELRLGRMREAEASYRRAIAIHRELGDLPILAGRLTNLAGVLSVLGEAGEAERLLREALTLYRDCRDRRGEGTALAALSTVEGERGSIDGAVALLEEAIQIHVELQNRSSEAVALLNLARFQRLRGELDASPRLCERSAEIARELRNEGLLGIALAQQCDHLRCAGMLDDADRLGAEARRLLSSSGVELHLVALACTLGHLELARGREASPYVSQVAEYVERIQAEPASPVRRALDRLVAAAAASERGETLVNGDAEEQVEEGVRRWHARQSR